MGDQSIGYRVGLFGLDQVRRVHLRVNGEMALFQVAINEPYSCLYRFEDVSPVVSPDPDKSIRQLRCTVSSLDKKDDIELGHAGKGYSKPYQSKILPDLLPDNISGAAENILDPLHPWPK